MKDALSSPKKYPVYCPWCKKEGRTTLVAMSTVEYSSGICKKHADELRKQAKEQAAHQAAQLNMFNR
ncbi:hypothetical protein PITCH_A1970004 [uncultured Desulfobacterium sp.]|uniref:Uncharacterized protein n=1 Tax=uncultured Desulfobacterium sp. TaxID=201089 RepID=A0A445MWF0_9BACT|nr:hypothetical protein PITCH_A1970004 [uncultured Desulfobacterium sp.]